MKKLSDSLRRGIRRANECFCAAMPDYVPLGLDWYGELKLIGIYWLVGVIISLWFFADMSSGINDLYYNDGITRVLMDRKMPDFYLLIEGKMDALLLGIVLAACIGVYHWLYHYRGSKSIYTMRRLPQRFELLKRCISVPFAVVTVMLVTAGILTLLYFWAYMANVPQHCIVPGQWERFVASLFGGKTL